ncbi:hypothetical protein K435DRAFT_671245 [Dendrothele bispora CBS 962.96]|uniref:EthD domain-containing protein n=1 Tax=Dendrothele bispora (strain CBS 962.96) TaxID=1314807 RepID=A0A4S8LTL2_DENBC|nr:hypothetical protein K435DRAFT_671245 [Dendrothele bispora CBS 962.96]
MSSQATDGQTPPRTGRVRLLSLLTKKPSISQEEFERYWLEKHSQLILSLNIVKKNLRRYELVRCFKSFHSFLQALRIPLIDCDGIGILEAESYEKIFEIFDDPEFKAIGEPDEEHFLDRSKTRVIPLDFLVFIDK